MDANDDTNDDTTSSNVSSESESESESEPVSVPGSLPPPKKKKKKRLCKYRAQWEEEFKWLESVRGEPAKANCTVCRRQFSVTHGGKSDVRQHGKGDHHKQALKQKKRQSALHQFVVPLATPEANKVTMLNKHVCHCLRLASYYCKHCLQ